MFCSYFSAFGLFNKMNKSPPCTGGWEVIRSFLEWQAWSRMTSLLLCVWLLLLIPIVLSINTIEGLWTWWIFELGVRVGCCASNSTFTANSLSRDAKINCVTSTWNLNRTTCWHTLYTQHLLYWLTKSLTPLNHKGRPYIW